MKRIAILALATTLLVVGCRKIEVDEDTTNTGGNNSGNTETVLTGKISTDKTLQAGKTYKLRGIVYVVDGAKLTIEPGVTIEGEKASRGTLVITRGSQIVANGTTEKPVVFTSDQANPQRGDWGGVVILGRAKTNANFNGVNGVGEIEGGVNNAEGLGLYGGTNDDDNSGALKFVRIEYAGYAFLPDKELNGLTLGGVGRSTVIDHVEVAWANDDSFEWFGGTVDAKHLISYKALDDDFDSDNGWAGRVQFAIAFRDSTVADISGSNGFESDNDAGGSSLTPQTAPVFSNVTLIGPRAAANNQGNSNYRRGAHVRRNSALSLANSIIMGWPTGWYVDGSTGTPTDLNLTANRAIFTNNILAGNTTQISYAASTSAPTGWSLGEVTNYFNKAGSGNTMLATTSEAGLVAPFKYDNAVNFNATANSAAAAGADFSNSKLSGGFFTATTFRGAAGVNDTWWKNWTKFN